MEEQYVDWIGSPESDDYCKQAISHFECIQEMKSFAKFQMLSPEMNGGLAQSSGSQSGKIRATMEAHAPAAYEKAMAALESSSSSDSTDDESSEGSQGTIKIKMSEGMKV
eukprot:814306-Amphidinium_carterae.1